MRTFATLAVAGVVGVVILKLLTALVLPLFGLVVGFVALAVKLALVAAVAFFIYSLIRKRKDEERAA